MSEEWMRLAHFPAEIAAKIDGVRASDGRPFGPFWIYKLWGVAGAFAPGGSVEQAGGTVFPSLHTPASKLPAVRLVWFAAQGVAPSADDTLLNLLRALRAARGADAAFDISNAE